MNDTNCRKCGALMPEPPKIGGVLGAAKFTTTAYRCEKCGHWNDLKKRKPRNPARKATQ